MIEENKSSNALKYFVVMTIFSVAALALYSFLWPEYQRSQILRRGSPAQATILKVRDTGNRYNDQPEVFLLLEVRPKDRAPFQAKVEMIISPVYIPQFQPGKVVSVRYDPKDLSKVAVAEE